MSLDPVVARLHSTTDAQVWAEEFMKVISQPNFQISTGFMIGWFANAIQTALTLNRENDLPLVPLPVISAGTVVPPPLTPRWKLLKDDKSHWHYERIKEWER